MITGYFGLPGSGKTTFLTKIAQTELRRIAAGKSKYSAVLTNFYCAGCGKVDYEQLGKYDIENCLILLDEITLDADSRNFKQFSQEKKEFFILHRHMNNDIQYFSQQWDGIDKKIRDLTQELYYVKKPMLWPFSNLTTAKRIFRTLEINDMTKEIVNGYRFPNWLEAILFRTKIFCLRPKWYKFFDSYELPDLHLPGFDIVFWDSDDKNTKKCA